MSLGLRGTLTSHQQSALSSSSSTTETETDTGTTQNTKVFWFHNDNNKKTSFLYDEDISKSRISSSISNSSSSRSSSDNNNTSVICNKPCHLFIDCTLHPTKKQISNDATGSGSGSGSVVEAGGQSFVFGGLEIYSNSRNIEVYIIPEDSTNDSFEYMKTCRGSLIIPDDEDEKDIMATATVTATELINTNSWEKELYKTIVIPDNSKPIPIKQLQLKLLSLRPAKCTVGYIKTIKLKGRLPEVNIVSTSSSSPMKQKQSSIQSKGTLHTNNLQHTNNNHPQSMNIQLGTSEITNAISAITVLIQNTQSSIEKSISTSIGETQKLSFQQGQVLHASLQSLEKSINDVSENLNSLRSEVYSFMKISREDDNDNATYIKDVGVEKIDADTSTTIIEEEHTSIIKRKNDKGEEDCSNDSIIEEINKSSIQNTSQIEQNHVVDIKSLITSKIKEVVMAEREVMMQQMKKHKRDMIDEIVSQISRHNISALDENIEEDDDEEVDGTAHPALG